VRPTTSSTPEPSRSEGPGASALTVWGGGIGVALLLGGIWVASPSLGRLGPELMVPLLLAAIGAGLVIAVAVLALLAPASVRDAFGTWHQLDALPGTSVANRTLRTSPVASVAGRVVPIIGYLRRVLGTRVARAGRRSARTGRPVAAAPRRRTAICRVGARGGAGVCGELSRLALDVATLEDSCVTGPTRGHAWASRPETRRAAR
jgi:hypothetical protein